MTDKFNVSPKPFVNSILIFDKNGVVESCNAVTEQMFGYESTEIVGGNCSLLISATKEEEIAFPIDLSRELLGKRKDGSTFLLDVQISEMTVNGQQKSVGIFRDKNEKKGMEKELNRAFQTLENRVMDRTAELVAANKKLAAFNKDMDDFSYMVSHELKAPLRGIYNYSYFLKKDYYSIVEEPGRRHIDSLVRLSKRMEHLINGILKYSRLGRMEITRVPADMNQIVNEAKESLYSLLKENKATVTVPRPLPIAECDPAGVQEVLRHLITNAIVYNDKTDKTVEIGYKEHSGPQCEQTLPEELQKSKWMENNPFTFYVKDNGIGIEEKYLESIFTLFKRLHGKDQYGGGLGVGLAIAQKIMGRQHGTLWAESTLGEGTTIYFTLPRVKRFVLKITPKAEPVTAEGKHEN